MDETESEGHTTSGYDAAEESDETLVDESIIGEIGAVEELPAAIIAIPAAVDVDELTDTYSKIGLGMALQRTLHKLLANYPCGISVSKFLARFKEVHHYIPNYQQFYCDTFQEMCVHQPNIFCIAYSTDLKEPILFKAKLKGNYLELFKTFFN